MPKKSRRKGRKKMANQGEPKPRGSEEEQRLRQLLEEKDLFRPGMRIREMRQLNATLEQSLLDYELYQQSARINESFPEEPKLCTPNRDIDIIFAKKLEFENNPSPEEESKALVPQSNANSPDPTPSNASFEKVRSSSQPEASNDNDSDSEGGYSPEFPGPCCRVDILVVVEIHPEPRPEEYDQRDDPMDTIESRGSLGRLRKAMSTSCDSIHEYV